MIYIFFFWSIDGFHTFLKHLITSQERKSISFDAYNAGEWFKVSMQTLKDYKRFLPFPSKFWGLSSSNK